MYIDARQQQKGPISTCDLKYLIAASHITTSTYGWAEGMADWAVLAQIPSVLPIFLEVGSMLETGWFYMDEYQYKRGPYDSTFMHQLYVSGQIGDDTLVWRSDQLTWQPLGKARDLVLPPSQKKHTSKDASAASHGEHKLDSERKGAGKTKKQLGGNDEREEEEEEEELDGHEEGLEGDELSEDETAQLGVKRPHAPDEELTEEQRRKRDANRERRKRAKMEKDIAFLERINRNNLYVEGLPTNWESTGMNEELAATFFRKAGIIRTDHENRPRIRFYKQTDPATGAVLGYKGDALVSYLKPESVDLAIDILDGQEIVPGYRVKLSRSQLNADGSLTREQLAAQGAELRAQFNKVKRTGAEAVKLASQQIALDWDEGVESGGLKIVLLQGLYTVAEALQARGIQVNPPPPGQKPVYSDYELAMAMDTDDPAIANYYERVKASLKEELERTCGPIKKISVFPGNDTGPAVVQFRTGAGAKACLAHMQGKTAAGRPIIAQYYDGRTDLKVKAPYIRGMSKSSTGSGEDAGKTKDSKQTDEEEEEEELDPDELRERDRLKAFGDWLEGRGA